MTQNVFLPVISKPSKSGSELAGHYLPRGRRNPGSRRDLESASHCLMVCCRESRTQTSDPQSGTGEKKQDKIHVLHHVLTHLINSQVDLISYFQAPIQSSYVEHVASSDLNVLHSEFCFLYREGNAPCELGERTEGDIIQPKV